MITELPPLTDDQQAAQLVFTQFLLHPKHHVMVLEGYAGTGKTTLVNRMLADLPQTLAGAKAMTGDQNDWEVVLTATTNKAAEALSQMVEEDVSTIQKYLGLIVQKDYKAKPPTARLVVKSNAEPKAHKILFIDEASFVDDQLLRLIFEQTDKCKIIFIGDPAQLAPVKSTKTPVFNAGFPTVRLAKVVRQAAGNQIIEVATGFRNTVNGAAWPKFKPNGTEVIHLSRQGYNEAIKAEFDRQDWEFADSKVLAWTNKTVITYNEAIRGAVQGEPKIQVGDYVVCNKHMGLKNCKLKTDQLVQVTEMYAFKSGSKFLGTGGFDGYMVTVDHQHTAFMPASQEIRKAALAAAKKDENFRLVKTIDTEWIDLRAAYACTVNKSQGSTYRKVFLDLDDIGACRSADQKARMLYVGVSRGSHQVFLTGDIYKRAA